MEKIKALFQSRKFYVLLTSLVTVYFGFIAGILTAEQAIVAALAALQTYSLGVAIAG